VAGHGTVARPGRRLSACSDAWRTRASPTNKSMPLFQEDAALAAHLALLNQSIKPTARRRAKRKKGFAPMPAPKKVRKAMPNSAAIHTSGFVRYVSPKGYGFLVDLENGDERSVFFAQSAAVRSIGRELALKERVRFTVVPSKFKADAVEAKHIELIEATAQAVA
jgi:cold shock CspA family protein